MACLHRTMPSRGDVLGHRHMSSGGLYITPTVWMCNGVQVGQKEPSEPANGMAKARMQRRQGVMCREADQRPSSLWPRPAKANGTRRRLRRCRRRRRTEQCDGGSGKAFLGGDHEEPSKTFAGKEEVPAEIRCWAVGRLQACEYGPRNRGGSRREYLGYP